MKPAEPMADPAESVAVDGDVFAELLDALHGLERAYVAWDLDAIDRQASRARAALVRVGDAGKGALASPEGQLKDLLAVTRRCQRLAGNGLALARALGRQGELTYAPPPADAMMNGPRSADAGFRGQGVDAIAVGEEEI